MTSLLSVVFVICFWMKSFFMTFSICGSLVIHTRIRTLLQCIRIRTIIIIHSGMVRSFDLSYEWKLIFPSIVQIVFFVRMFLIVSIQLLILAIVILHLGILLLYRIRILQWILVLMTPEKMMPLWISLRKRWISSHSLWFAFFRFLFYLRCSLSFILFLFSSLLHLLSFFSFIIWGRVEFSCMFF